MELGFHGKIARLFGVSRWTICHRVQTYGMSRMSQFSTLSHRYHQLDEIVKDYLSRQGLTFRRLFEIIGF